MGIYVFNRKVLIEALDNQLVDFGKHILPAAIGKYAMHAYIFQGYWEDIGTIRAFFDANLNLTNAKPEYSFFDTAAPVYTHARFLPASKINGANVKQAVISDGCVISDAQIERCVIGVRSYIGSGTTIRNSIVMGSDFYEANMTSNPKTAPELGVGKNCVIDHAIIDKNARIGDGVVISPEGKAENYDGENFYVRDGIVVVPKNAVIPSGTWV
jgi:glucose-1-phosphate adenylyltransferase